MKKVLIISYYWPPSGGAGVQRWLKLSKYLALQGNEVHVLTVDPEKASYMAIDPSLNADVHELVKVHRTKSFEIINIYAKLVGKKNVPTAGFSNVDNKNFLQKLINSLRSNFFIPDPRIGWKKYAVKKATEIIKVNNINTIITTSPPHSTHLIGYQLKKNLSLKWIVDLRDPWTDIYYYNLLGHSWISKRIDAAWEKRVLLQSDKVVTVSEGFKSIFLTKSNHLTDDKIKVIPNGFDEHDFKTVSKSKTRDNTFLISYTGTMSDQYEPNVLFSALDELGKANKSIEIIFQSVGIVSQNIKDYLAKMSFKIELINTVPHDMVNKYQTDSDLLLLVIPNTKLSNGITPGKLFEYLATKNQIIAIGPTDSDVNRILLECEAGKCYERNQESLIKQFIQDQIDAKLSGRILKPNLDALKKYSRESQAKEIASLI